MDKCGLAGMKVVTASAGTAQASDDVKKVASKHFDLCLKLEATRFGRTLSWLKNSCLQSLPSLPTFPLREWFNTMGKDCLIDPQAAQLIHEWRLCISLLLYEVQRNVLKIRFFKLSGGDHLFAVCLGHTKHNRGQVPRLCACNQAIQVSGI